MEEKPITNVRGCGGGQTYLHHQDDHADGSQQVLVVIQPFLHFLEAALKWDRRR